MSELKKIFVYFWINRKLGGGIGEGHWGGCIAGALGGGIGKERIGRRSIKRRRFAGGLCERALRVGALGGVKSTDSFSYVIQFFRYLSAVSFHIFHKIDLISTVRDVYLFDPHANVLSSLHRHLDDSGRSTEVNLQVLVPIVHPCAPGSHVFSLPRALEPTQECCVVFVPLRRGLHLTRS